MISEGGAQGLWNREQLTPSIFQSRNPTKLVGLSEKRKRGQEKEKK